jgi:hypothetical protein
MCFSAEASFVAGVSLLAAGAYGVKCALARNRRYLPLALTPVFFGLQQLAEVIVWVGLDHLKPELSRTGSLVFLFFALFFWPFWLPICAAFVESRPLARWIWAAVAFLSLGWFFFLQLPLMLDPQKYLTTGLVHHSIAYDHPNVPLMRLVSRDVLRAIYMLMGGVPLLACSDSRARIFGALLGLSAVASRVLFAYAFASVWCFFAALLALYLCVAMARVPVPQPNAP